MQLSEICCCVKLELHDDFEAGSICALLSILPNILLLLTFAATRKRDKALKMGATHFIILAVLDIVYGLVDSITDFPFHKVFG